MKRKNLTFFVTALLCSLGMVLLLNYWFSTPSKEETAKPVTEAVLTAPENLSEGAIISIEKMNWTEWPLETIQEDYITKKNKEALKAIDGGVVKVSISKGEPIKVDKIINTYGKSALSAVIREGMRAVAVPFNKLANAPALISPGDVVDVIIPKRTQGNTEGYFGQTILKGVRVLAVNKDLQKSGEQESSTAATQSITLEVSADQAEDLAAAIRDGQVVVSMQSVFANSETPTTTKKQTIEPQTPEIKTVTIMRGADKKDMTFKKSGNLK